MRLTGTDGEITFPMFTSAPVRLEDGSGVQRFDLPYPPHVAQPLIQSIVDDLLGRGECPSTGVGAAHVARHGPVSTPITAAAAILLGAAADLARQEEGYGARVRLAASGN